MAAAAVTTCARRTSTACVVSRPRPHAKGRSGLQGRRKATRGWSRAVFGCGPAGAASDDYIVQGDCGHGPGAGVVSRGSGVMAVVARAYAMPATRGATAAAGQAATATTATRRGARRPRRSDVGRGDWPRGPRGGDARGTSGGEEGRDRQQQQQRPRLAHVWPMRCRGHCYTSAGAPNGNGGGGAGQGANTEGTNLNLEYGHICLARSLKINSDVTRARPPGPTLASSGPSPNALTCGRF